MANFDKWAQSTKGHTPAAGTAAKAAKVKPFGADNIVSPFGQQSPFGNVQPGNGASPFSGMGSGAGASMQQAIQAPFVVKPGSVTGMGPYVAGSQQPTSVGSWSGGPLGAVPNHKGWGGMKDSTKQWALRILGSFPGLRFSSGFRTPAENAAVNGDPNSGHMRGDKFDLSGSTKDLYAAAAWAKRYGARTLLHDAGSGFHLDISWAGVNA